MSNLEDSRVLSAFSSQQSALPYMLNVEQRLSKFKGDIAALQGMGTDQALVAQVNTNTANIATNTANIASNTAAIATLNNTVGINTYYNTSINQTITSTAWTLIAGFDLTINIAKNSSRVLVAYNIPEAYISGGTAFGRLAIREGNGSYRETSILFGDGVSSPMSGFMVYPRNMGSVQFRLYGMISVSGSSMLLDSNGSVSATFLVMQIS